MEKKTFTIHFMHILKEKMFKIQVTLQPTIPKKCYSFK